ncbi:MAG: hypothetical protein HY689_07840 [Chloroflexi bacterium]|nr:hypothetical protein [Chloroflexota bacterium]
MALPSRHKWADNLPPDRDRQEPPADHPAAAREDAGPPGAPGSLYERYQRLGVRVSQERLGRQKHYAQGERT